MATAAPIDHPNPTPRHDGFTPERQTLFLDALASSGSVSTAAQAAGVSRTAAYNFRNRDDAAGEAFRAAWDGRLRQAVAVLAETAFDRAINGVEVPVFHKGEQIGIRIRHNDRLLMFLLKTLDPETYGPKPANDKLPLRQHIPASLLSTSSTQAEDEEEMTGAQFREELRALRDIPPPVFTSKRNARRLAAKQRKQGLAVAP